MQKIRRGQGTRKSIRRLIRYQFANKNASLICSSNVLVSRDVSGLVEEIYEVTSTIGLDVEKPLWHNSLRLKPGEFISAELWVDVVCQYMVSMGFDPDNHQWFAVLSDDPDGQHVHITANRMGVDGTLYLGQNENLISTRITQELERKFHLQRTKGPQYVLGKDGKLRVSAPRERRAKKDEVELHARLEREGKAKPMPRKALQRVLRAALFAGQVDGLRAFLNVAEAAGVRVLASVATTGRINGLSFETGGVPFKGSQLGDVYSWAKLSAAVGFEQARDQALLEARSLRHVTRDELPPLGQPAPSTWMPAPPAAATPIAINTAPQEEAYVQRYQPTYRARRTPTAPVGRLSLARRPSIDGLRHLPGGTLDAAGSPRRTDPAPEGVVPRDDVVQLGEFGRPHHRLRHPAGAGAGPAAVAASRGLTRDASMLEEARLGQRIAALPDSPALIGEGVVVTVVVTIATALDGYRPKTGNWGTLYVRAADDCLAVVDTGERVKVAHVDADAVRAGLAVAASKWQTLTIRGSDKFKALAAREAVRLGLADRIVNPEPELQAVIAAERARLAAPKSHVVDSRATPAPTPGAGIPNSWSLETPSRTPVPLLTPRRTPRPR